MAAASRAQTGTLVMYRESASRSGRRAVQDGLTAQAHASRAQKTTLRIAKMLRTTRRKVMPVKRYDARESCEAGRERDEGASSDGRADQVHRMAKIGIGLLSRAQTRQQQDLL